MWPSEIRAIGLRESSCRRFDSKGLELAGENESEIQLILERAVQMKQAGVPAARVDFEKAEKRSKEGTGGGD